MTREMIERYAQESKAEQLELLRALASIPAPTRHEEKRAKFVQNWLVQQGATDVSIDDAQNVICKIGPMNGDLVVFAAHTDIVFPDTDPIAVTEQEGKLFAPGIGDDSSNLVNLMMAAKYALKNGLLPKGCGVLIVANSCEEGLGNLDGVKKLFADYGKQIVRFHSFDGYTPQCCSTAVGSYRYRIECRAAGGHSYLNFGEPNAIEILCRLAEKLYKIEAPCEEKTTYNIGRIEGGTTVNSLPQQASMLYEFRSTSQKCLSYMEERFVETVENVRRELTEDVSRFNGTVKPGELEIVLLGIRPGNGELDPAVLKQFTEENAEIISRYYDGPIDFAPYSTDSNVPLSLGIPANTIGTVLGGLAHTREEWIYMDSLTPGLSIALSVMLRYFS